LKSACNYITNTENFKVIDEINKKGIKINKEGYNLLNSLVYDKLNEHFLNKLKIINRLKAGSIHSFDNVEYELYLTPDTSRVKLYTKLTELRKMITNIEMRIGEWDIVKFINLEK
jgi:hypothetical protein